MIARIGRSASGADETQKSDRNPAPFLMNPTSVTVMKTAKAMTAVTAICEVVVKLVGIRPSTLASMMNMKSVMI
jgi:hypothetical protein